MLFPDFEIWSQFPGKEILPSLALDSLRSSHPVEVYTLLLVYCTNEICTVIVSIIRVYMNILYAVYSMFTNLSGTNSRSKKDWRNV